MRAAAFTDGVVRGAVTNRTRRRTPLPLACAISLAFGACLAAAVAAAAVAGNPSASASASGSATGTAGTHVVPAAVLQAATATTTAPATSPEAPPTKTCALTRAPPTRPSPPLGFCRQYAHSACCDAATAKLARTPFTAAHPFASCPGCVHNLATLQCAVRCSPTQSRFVAPHLCPPANVTCDKANPFAKPKVELCAAFCRALFRSCSKVVPRGGTTSIAEEYFDSTARQTKKNIKGEGSTGGVDGDDDTEMAAARLFCLDQFKDSFKEFTVSIVKYDEQAHIDGGRHCLGHVFGEGTVGFSADCDPFEDDRFWHVMSESMEVKHGVGLALVSLMLLAAAACVGYAMTVARRRAEWVSERWIQEKHGARGSSNSSNGRAGRLKNTESTSGGSGSGSRHAEAASSSARDDVDAVEGDSLLFSEQPLAEEDGVAGDW